MKAKIMLEKSLAKIYTASQNNIEFWEDLKDMVLEKQAYYVENPLIYLKDLAHKQYVIEYNDRVNSISRPSMFENNWKQEGYQSDEEIERWNQYI